MRFKNAGFSLVELIVAFTIGGVILSTVMVSYVSLAKMKRTLDITRQVQREVNFATMRISDRARAYSVNYEKLDVDNHHFLPLGEDEFRYDAETMSLFMNDSPLFSPSLNVEKTEFNVFPGLAGKNVQPWVRIEMLVSAKGNPEISVPVRTTISSRLIK